MGSNGLPPVRIPRRVRDISDPDYDEFMDYWWPRILRECDEYQRTREHRQRITDVVLLMLLILFAGGAAAMARHVSREVEPSVIDVPYTEDK